MYANTKKKVIYGVFTYRKRTGELKSNLRVVGVASFISFLKEVSI
jgi:hypothetical protein